MVGDWNERRGYVMGSVAHRADIERVRSEREGSKMSRELARNMEWHRKRLEDMVTSYPRPALPRVASDRPIFILVFLAFVALVVLVSVFN